METLETVFLVVGSSLGVGATLWLSGGQPAALEGYPSRVRWRVRNLLSRRWVTEVRAEDVAAFTLARQRVAVALSMLAMGAGLCALSSVALAQRLEREVEADEAHGSEQTGDWELRAGGAQRVPDSVPSSSPP